MFNKESMDDDYVSLSFETNKHETFVNARNSSLVPLLVAARRLPANVTLHVLYGAGSLRQREESISCSMPGARGLRVARGADTEVDKREKRWSETGRHVFAAPLKTTSAK